MKLTEKQRSALLDKAYAYADGKTGDGADLALIEFVENLPTEPPIGYAPGVNCEALIPVEMPEGKKVEVRCGYAVRTDGWCINTREAHRQEVKS